uniref:EGF-like domain-containing protein n=1 Tax=Arcella intermedia TaxID=1963864 RepID=A0A6B2L1U9_9EUKA
MLLSGSCVDVDECKSNPCGSGSKCKNLEGTYQCYCNSTTQELNNDNICQEIDPCTEGTHNCQQLCENTKGGSYRCSCFSGYYLMSDLKSCSSEFAYEHGSIYTTLIHHDDFCSIPSDIERDPNVVTQGCKATKPDGTEHRCIFPFYYAGIKFENCTTIGLGRDAPPFPWCAVSVTKDLQVVERGNCSCSEITINLIYHQGAFFLFGSSNPNAGNDGNKDDNTASALNIFYDNWLALLSSPVVPHKIIFYGCPSCYKNIQYFTVHVSLIQNLQGITSGASWEKVLYFNSTFLIHEIVVPKDIPYLPQYLYVWTDTNVYFAEIEALGAVVPLNSPFGTLDCSLSLSRNAYYVVNDTKDAILTDPVHMRSKTKVSLLKNFVQKFNFKVSPGTSDIFSIFIEAPTNNSTNLTHISPHLLISFDPKNSLVSITGFHLSSSINSPSTHLTPFNEMSYTCIISYEVAIIDSNPTSSIQSSGLLSVYLNNFTETVIKQSVFLSCC